MASFALTPMEVVDLLILKDNGGQSLVPFAANGMFVVSVVYYYLKTYLFDRTEDGRLGSASE